MGSRSPPKLETFYLDHISQGVTVKLPVYIVKLLDILAEQRGVPRSEIIREAILEYLERWF